MDQSQKCEREVDGDSRTSDKVGGSCRDRDKDTDGERDEAIELLSASHPSSYISSLWKNNPGHLLLPGGSL